MLMLYHTEGMKPEVCLLQVYLPDTQLRTASTLAVKHVEGMVRYPFAIIMFDWFLIHNFIVQGNTTLFEVYFKFY